MIDLLAIPFLACILLTLIHVYFGSFVLRRGILFIDLALAQWAALGYMVGHYYGVHHPTALFLMAFSFTVFAGALLSVLKPIFDRVHLQEALIGVLYIFATAFATALLSSTGMEASHLKEMLSGHLLFLQVKELGISCLLYLGVAVFLYRFHHSFLKGSKASDFLFYLLFGLVVTSSVKMVGILLVFSFLVIPVLTISLFTDTLKTQVFYGTMLGVVASLMGLSMSFLIDIPPSFLVIFALSFCLFLGVLKKAFLK
ncbi:hypothetical protein DID77_01850 [Candidatus Marinamargulisbacteria bacterium SCGC AG-439-L15]|nr:hypothetical protein DID77_01850 [Candidatus Marinamargulisbacteria bacterium SCGC AG-439-L15]